MLMIYSRIHSSPQSYREEIPCRGKCAPKILTNSHLAFIMKKTAILLSLIISVNAQDITAPTVSTYSPADGATGVSLTTNLVLTFSENVTLGTGNITIKKSSNNSTVETINVVSDTGNVSISGSTVTISRNTTLTYSADCELADPDDNPIQIKGYGEGVIDAK